MPDQPYINTSRRNASLRVSGASPYLYYTTTDENMQGLEKIICGKCANYAQKYHKKEL